MSTKLNFTGLIKYGSFEIREEAGRFEGRVIEFLTLFLGCFTNF